VNLLFGDRTMFDATGHDEELPLLQTDVTLPELHPESSFDHQEEFIFAVMLVPDKLTLELGQLDVLPVQLAHNLGAPVIVEESELFPDIHLGYPSASEGFGDELPLAD
jgi:hypothetical protein